MQFFFFCLQCFFFSLGKFDVNIFFHVKVNSYKFTSRVYWTLTSLRRLSSLTTLPIPNISGAKWFVSFIDDCTRVTWGYSEVSIGYASNKKGTNVITLKVVKLMFSRMSPFMKLILLS